MLGFRVLRFGVRGSLRFMILGDQNSGSVGLWGLVELQELVS